MVLMSGSLRSGSRCSVDVPRADLLLGRHRAPAAPEGSARRRRPHVAQLLGTPPTTPTPHLPGASATAPSESNQSRDGPEGPHRYLETKRAAFALLCAPSYAGRRLPSRTPLVRAWPPSPSSPPRLFHPLRAERAAQILSSKDPLAVQHLSKCFINKLEFKRTSDDTMFSGGGERCPSPATRGLRRVLMTDILEEMKDRAADHRRLLRLPAAARRWGPLAGATPSPAPTSLDARSRRRSTARQRRARLLFEKSHEQPWSHAPSRASPSCSASRSAR